MHQNDVAANLNSDLLDYLKDQNVFMERLLTMLNQGLVSKDLREFARFRTSSRNSSSSMSFCGRRSARGGRGCRASRRRPNRNRSRGRARPARRPRHPK